MSKSYVQMYKIGLFYLVLLSVNGLFNPACAQNFTIDDYRKGFDRQYGQCVSAPDMSRYDKIIFSSKFLTETDRLPEINITYLNEDQHLRTAGKVKLPPSLYLEQCKDEGPCTLCWVGLRDSTQKELEADIRAKLKKRYGSMDVGKGIEVVPAVWYSGTLQRNANPDWYGGFLVSGFYSEQDIVKGVSVGKLRYNRMPGSSLRADVKFINTQHLNKNIVVKNDSPSLPLAMVKLSLNLLARDLNRTLNKRPEKDSREKYSYPIIIMTDSLRKSHVYAVYPDSLDDVGKQHLASLSWAMDQQPTGLFSSSQTSDGRWFHALFVKATYSDYLGRWTFDEYPRVHFWPYGK